MTKIELLPAYRYDCPECGRENFIRGVVPEFSPEDLQELRDEHGLEAWETVEFVTIPASVTCQHCNSEFETLSFREESEE